MQVIILAGGKGTRLRPFTYTLPKPLMPIGEIPIIEIILKQLKYYRINDIFLSVNHLSEIIMAFIGNGEKFGLNIEYSVENKQLGTAGPISLLKDKLEENFIVMNGDLLTTLNYQEIIDHHLKTENIATIATYTRRVSIDFGVLEIENNYLKNYIEKPSYNYNVSMGINIFNRRVLQYIEYNKRMDIPELMIKLKESGETVFCYDSNKYYWLDIGRVDDYDLANNIFLEKKRDFLHE